VNERENHDLCTRKFIDLANSLKDEGHPVQLVSAALLAASGIYLTFATAGNAGALEPSGVDKAVAMFRRNLEHIQARKKSELGGAVN